MKVLYLTTVPTPYKVDFFEELGKECDLTVLFENRTVSYREESWMVKEFRNFNAVFLNGVNIRDNRISFDVIGYLDASKYDHIIISVYSSLTQMIAQLYMRMKRIDYILSSDGGMVKNDSRITAKVKSYFISGARYWLSTGKTTTDYLCNYGAKKGRIFTYPFTSIKDDEILESQITAEERNGARETLGIKEQKILISIGQFIHRKGMDILIRVASELPDVGFYIIGGTPTKEYEDMKSDLLAKNVHFVGFKQKKELSSYFKAADIFALATREDIWGLVINEAMAYGLPVITTDRCVAGLEMVEEGITGSIVPVDNIEAIKRRINYWLNKDNVDHQAILLTARRYTIEAMARRHIEILNMISKR